MNWKDKHVQITGGAAFNGSSLVDALGPPEDADNMYGSFPPRHPAFH
jgi:hypothetical protein